MQLSTPLPLSHLGGRVRRVLRYDRFCGLCAPCSDTRSKRAPTRWPSQAVRVASSLDAMEGGLRFGASWRDERAISGRLIHQQMQETIKQKSHQTRRCNAVAGPKIETALIRRCVCFFGSLQTLVGGPRYAREWGRWLREREVSGGLWLFPP